MRCHLSHHATAAACSPPPAADTLKLGLVAFAAMNIALQVSGQVGWAAGEAQLGTGYGRYGKPAFSPLCAALNSPDLRRTYRCHSATS